MANKKLKLNLSTILKKRLQDALNIGLRQINRQIQNISKKYICSREYALWVLCYQKGISLEKLLTNDQLDKLRGIMGKNIIEEVSNPKKNSIKKSINNNQKENRKKIKFDNKIFKALKKNNEQLAKSYYQSKCDLSDDQRISWSGTAHEIREILRILLNDLAPDDKIVNEKWYKQMPNCSGPTQSQKVKYILINRKTGSKISEVTEKVDLIDDKICSFIRSVYNRASDAAHRLKEKEEIEKIMRYFEAFCYDLLEI